MKSKILNLCWLLPAALTMFLSSCRPGELDYIEDYDIVYTDYKKDFDFNTVNTYFLPDSVVHVVPPGETADHRFDAQILSTLKTNLDALGWTRLSTGGATAADVIVLPSANSSTYTSCASYCWYCYWGWYPGWGYYPPVWGNGWGWGYPSSVVCSSYSTGTVVVNITAPKLAGNNTLPVAWMGILNGLLEGSDASINDRIGKNINQMFIQSPYLK
ncbi:MAG TPA: DUF4136 domain-containing protein [Chitinophagaceae bacterium]